MRQRFSLHKVYTEEKCPFSKIEYSQFKFGNTFYAEKFAQEIFQQFIGKYRDLILSQPEIIIFPSPYSAIPTASSFLCDFFKIYLNRFLYAHDRKSCIEGKIYRNQTYVEDYGDMDFEERLNLISNDTYYIDRNFVQEKFCLFLDDIKITGSHERTIDQILKKYNVSGDFFFIYYAELCNVEIHPRIENHYNYYTIKSVDDIIKIVNSDFFQFNTRIVKYILSLKKLDFDFICQNFSTTQLLKLMDLAVSNNYHQIEDYQSNIIKLKSKLWQSTYKRDKEKTLAHLNLSSD